MFKKKYTKILSVEGMHCQHCVMTIENELKKIGDIKIKTDLNKKQVKITSNEYIDNKKITESFANLEFTLKEIKDI